MKVLGCILAGGRSSRFGSDKAMALLDGKTLLDHAIARLAPQADQVIINTNSADIFFKQFGIPVVPDLSPSFDGPLAGVLAALTWAKANRFAYVVSVAVDTPGFPLNLVQAFEPHQPGTIKVAQSPSGLHPAFGLWPADTREKLAEWLSKGGSKKMLAFLESQTFQPVVFDLAPNGADPFFNINLKDDLFNRLAKNAE